MEEVSIKTSLFYLFGEQKEEVKESLTEFFELENKLQDNLSDLLVYAVGKNVEVSINVEYYNTLPEKHQKTFLIYFSEEEHKLVNDYINSFIPKSLDLKIKKKARTDIVLQMINEAYELQY